MGPGRGISPPSRAARAVSATTRYSCRSPCNARARSWPPSRRTPSATGRRRSARAPVETQLAQGSSVVLEIDWQGARQVRDAMPECSTIFVLPPSRRALEERLRQRATDSDAVIARRLRDAVSDMSHWREFDYVIVNEDFDKAVADLVRIVDGRGEDLKARRPQLQPLLAELLG